MRKKKKEDMEKGAQAGWVHGVTEAQALEGAVWAPCHAPPTPAWGAQGLPGAPGHWTIAHLLQGLAAQLEQHSLLPDWPRDLLCLVTPGKHTGSVNNWRLLGKKKKKSLTTNFLFWCSLARVVKVIYLGALLQGSTVPTRDLCLSLPVEVTALGWWMLPAT